MTDRKCPFFNRLRTGKESKSVTPLRFPHRLAFPRNAGVLSRTPHRLRGLRPAPRHVASHAHEAGPARRNAAPRPRRRREKEAGPQSRPRRRRLPGRPSDERDGDLVAHRRRSRPGRRSVAEGAAHRSAGGPPAGPPPARRRVLRSGFRKSSTVRLGAGVEETRTEFVPLLLAACLLPHRKCMRCRRREQQQFTCRLQSEIAIGPSKTAADCRPSRSRRGMPLILRYS
jgi:hypothetical protein